MTDTSTPSLNSQPAMDGANYNVQSVARLTAIAEAESPSVVDEPKKAPTAPVASDNADFVDYSDEPEEIDDTDEEESEVEDDETDPEVTEEEDEEEVKAPSKKIKAKVNGKELELAEDTIIPVKVNGEIQEIALKDLTTSYSGRAEISRRFTELDKAKKQLAAQTEQFFNEKSGVEAHLQLMSMLEPQEFMHHLAELQGRDPDELYGSMVEQIVKTIKEMQGMSPEHRKLHNEARKLKAEKKIAEVRSRVEQQLEKHKETFKTQQQRYDQFMNEMNTMGLTEKDYASAAQEIEAKIKEGQLSGEWTEFDVLDYAREKNVLTTINESANNMGIKVDPAYIKKIRAAIAADEQSNQVIYSPDEIEQLTKRLIKLDKKRVRETPKAAAKQTATPERKQSPKTKEKEIDSSFFDTMRVLRR